MGIDDFLDQIDAAGAALVAESCQKGFVGESKKFWFYTRIFSKYNNYNQ